MERGWWMVCRNTPRHTHTHTELNVKRRWKTDKKKKLIIKVSVCAERLVNRAAPSPPLFHVAEAARGGSGDGVLGANRAFHLMAEWWCERTSAYPLTHLKSHYHSVTASSATRWHMDLNSLVLIKPGAQMTVFLFRSQWLNHPSYFIKVRYRICLNHLTGLDWTVQQPFLTFSLLTFFSFNYMRLFWLTGLEWMRNPPIESLWPGTNAIVWAH